MATDLEPARTDADLVEIRALKVADLDALLALNDHVSDRSLYRRFFIVSRHAADVYVDQLLRPSRPTIRCWSAWTRANSSASHPTSGSAR
jgi:hypothetical protein